MIKQGFICRNGTLLQYSKNMVVKFYLDQSMVICRTYSYQLPLIRFVTSLMDSQDILWGHTVLYCVNTLRTTKRALNVKSNPTREEVYRLIRFFLSHYYQLHLDPSKI